MDERIKVVIQEAERFIRRAKAARTRLAEEGNTVLLSGCKEMAAMRRSSMDLTRALADLRKRGVSK